MKGEYLPKAHRAKAMILLKELLELQKQNNNWKLLDNKS